MAKVQVLTEFLDAAHMTAWVNHQREQRGGIMLVGPPGTLKSSIIDVALQHYPTALYISDLNINTLTKMKDDMISGRYQTLGLEEFQKLYERAPTTSKNIEGVIKALTDQGFSHASFEDQRTAALKARMLIIGAMTLGFYGTNFGAWRESGFARRFIWMVYRTSDYRTIGDAIERRKTILLNSFSRRWPPPEDGIPFQITDQDAARLREMLKDQPEENTTQILLQKIYAVLLWKYEGDAQKVWKVLDDMRPLMSKTGGEIQLEYEKTAKSHNLETSGIPIRPGTVRRNHSRTTKIS